LSTVGAPLVALVGALGVAALLGRRPLPAPRWAFAAVLGPALGLGTLSLLYFFWRFAGGSSASFAPLGWLVLAGVAVGALRRLRRDRLPGKRAEGAATGHLVRRAAVSLLVASALLALAAGVLYARQVPHGRFDAWAIWTNRARMLHRTDDPARVFSQLRRAHPDYPLLLPGSLAAQFALFANESPRIPQGTGGLFFLSAAAALALAVRALGSSASWTALAPALFLVTPAAVWWGFAQCADVPLAYLLVACGTLLALQLPVDRPAPVPPALAGFLLGLLPWAKNEGLLLAGALAGLFAACTATSPAGRRRLAFVVAGALPGGIAVGLMRLFWAPHTDLGHFASGVVSRLVDGSRWQVVLSAFRDRLDPLRGFADWGVVWPLAALAILVTSLSPARRRPGLAFLLGALGLLWVTWLGVFLGTPNDPDWQIRTALDRLLLQLLPLTLAVGFGGLGDSAPSRTSTPHAAGGSAEP
jgi:hypothetical protein